MLRTHHVPVSLTLGLLAVSSIDNARAVTSRREREPMLDQFPTVELPTVELPTVELPTVELPTVELPSIDFPTIDFPTIEVPDWVPADCFSSLEKLGEETADVVVECVDVAARVPDLISFGGVEETLEGVCAAIGDLSECNAEVFEMTEQFIEATDDCADDFGFEEGTIPGSPEKRLTNVLMNEVLCMENPYSDRLCIVEVYNFVKDRAVLYDACIDDMFKSECSDECTDLAREFVESVGCCATGILYAAEAFPRIGVKAADVGHLTACGTQIFSCEPLQDAFSQATTSIELPPLQAGLESTDGLSVKALVGILLVVALLLTGAGTLTYNMWWKRRRSTASGTTGKINSNSNNDGETVDNTI